MKLFLIRAPGTEFDSNPSYVLVFASDREAAKNQAMPHMNRLRGGPETWDVLPLTEEGAHVHLSITLD